MNLFIPLHLEKIVLARRLLLSGIIAAAVLLGGFVAIVALGSERIPGNNDSMNDGITESINAEGYVVVSIVRDGNEIYHYESHNLITNAGKDYISSQIGSTSQSSGANYIALSSDTGSPSSSDTTLASEITTNGLARAQGTYSHTAGTNTFTVSKQFTATGTVTGVQKTGLFTASSAGTMMAENTFTSANLISGDQLTVTWTITVG